MSIENLNTAVRAAGFAMATSDETTDEAKADRQLQVEAWRPGEAIVLADDETAGKVAPSIGDRLKGVLGLFGRSAPA
jgi:predicted pyridoxine 5'-phosphate oxidase superfamily flavin-nucleotide-binding protein